MAVGAYNEIYVAEDGLITSTTNKFEPMRLNPMSPLPRQQFLSANFAAIHAVAFVGMHPIECVDNLIASGLRRELVQDAKNIVAHKRLKHRKHFSRILDIVAPKYNAQHTYDPTTVLGDRDGKKELWGHAHHQSSGR
ncbi:MAG: hypothetical protein ABJ246_09520 [Paracoccaceae bacterium]